MEKYRDQVEKPLFRGISVLLAIVALLGGSRLSAQNRGVYPLGMSATGSGNTPGPGFSYSNQLLYYSRDRAKDDSGGLLPVTGHNYVLMDMNSLIWVSKKKMLGGAAFSAVATLPFARNNLTSDLKGEVSGGGGFADSYYMPFILGWDKERVDFRAVYGFLAPTGRFVAGASDNIGSGYWTHALSSGQTVSLDRGGRFILSAFELYEFHTTQTGTGIHPGQTFSLDYSLLTRLPALKGFRFQAGPAGYEQRQTTGRTGPELTAEQSKERYAVNAIGFACTVTAPNNRVNLALKYFKEFGNRSTFQGYSLQFTGSFKF